MAKSYPRMKMRPDRLPVIHPAPVQAQKMAAFRLTRARLTALCCVCALSAERQYIRNYIGITDSSDIVIIRAVGNLHLHTNLKNANSERDFLSP